MEDFTNSPLFRVGMIVLAVLGLVVLIGGVVLKHVGWGDYEFVIMAGSGLLITDLSGLHAGANPISGDFSLLSKGFVIRDGAQAEPVERITVAGNIYQLLKSVRAVGSDLEFPGSPIGSPSVDAGMMPVSGK